MGKKGSGWITALKKAFTTNPKDKPTNVQLVAQYPQPPQQYRGSARDKKRWGFGRSRQHADPAPLMSIPLYRQPSSIEKILGDAEMERQYYGRPPAQYQITPAKPTTATVAATAPTTPAVREREREREWGRDRERDRERDAGADKQQRQQHATVLQLPAPPSSPPPLIRRFDHDREQQQRLQRLQQGRAEMAEWRQPPPQQHMRTRARQRAVAPEQARAAAVAIQAAFRGYSARRSYRSLRGLIRLQAVVRGPSVRRQTAHAMRCMQTLVRVQSQVRASRVEAMERRNLRHGATLRDGRMWRSGSQDGGMWDDSLLSRDEADARTKRKAEAVMKRERALAYSYSHQVMKSTPMAAHAILADLQSGRNPWWWSPIDRSSHEREYPRHVEPAVSRPRPTLAVARREMSMSMMTPMSTAGHREMNTHMMMTPMSMSMSTTTAHREMNMMTPISTTAAHRQMSMATPMTTAANTPARSVASAYYKQPSKPARGARGAAPPSSHGGGSVRDDESLTSCPAFGVPNYMTPTMSASAKARARAHVLQQQLEKERRAAEQKPRFSFGLGQSIGSWAKSPFWRGGGVGDQSAAPSRVGTPAASTAGGGGRHKHRRSVSGLSVDSTVSMPAGVGRRSFK
ncbi:hypothetical protein ZWY2020_046959 [Hordeum vulgare]|nr:hypothetical protein ZWY2020_046959 [Hordeum vulgare]